MDLISFKSTFDGIPQHAVDLQTRKSQRPGQEAETEKKSLVFFFFFFQFFLLLFFFL